MEGLLRRARAGLASGASLLGVGCGLIWQPEPVMPMDVLCRGDVPPLPQGRPVKVLVWNAQFLAGRSQHFFYDGGEAVHVPAADVERTLAEVVDLVRRHDPDVILWQELDRGSDRTGRVDQVASLLEALPSYTCHTSAPYHRAPYVPHPPHEHLRRVDMHLAVFSRYRIDRATRHQLPLLQESWIRQQFNLRRALLDVRLRLDDGGTLAVLNTHLSAFSKGDGTLGRQIAHIDRHLGELDALGIPWLLGGDFNSLPPGDDPARLGPDAHLYAEEPSPVALLFEHHQAGVPLHELQQDPAPWRTYLPFGAPIADRTIDYVFTSREGIEPYTFAVDSSAAHTSDHLPLVSEIAVRPEP